MNRHPFIIATDKKILTGDIFDRMTEIRVEIFQHCSSRTRIMLSEKQFGFQDPIKRNRKSLFNLIRRTDITLEKEKSQTPFYQ